MKDWPLIVKKVPDMLRWEGWCWLSPHYGCQALVLEWSVDWRSVETVLFPLSQSVVEPGRPRLQPGGRWSILRSPHLTSPRLPHLGIRLSHETNQPSSVRRRKLLVGWLQIRWAGAGGGGDGGMVGVGLGGNRKPLTPGLMFSVMTSHKSWSCYTEIRSDQGQHHDKQSSISR